MPIHDVGYRTWSRDKASQRIPLTDVTARFHWLAISQAGINMALKSRWIRRVLMLSWISIIYLGVGFFGFERFMETDGPNTFSEPGAAQGQGGENQWSDLVENADEFSEDFFEARRREQLADSIALLPKSQGVVNAIEGGDLRVLRHQMWSYLLWSFLSLPQGILTLLVVGLIVPPLISRDWRSRAFLLYYARPIVRLEYLLGKLAVPAFILSLITLIPALGLYVFGLLLSPDLRVIADTWDLPIRTVLASAACILPVSLLSLTFSSMTQESRFAGFAWFAVWLLGLVMWLVISIQLQAESFVMMEQGETVSLHVNSAWSVVSLYETIGRTQSWIFGLEPNLSSALPSLITIGLLSVVSVALLYQRVSAPVKI
jgi:hypothetical protein